MFNKNIKAYAERFSADEATDKNCISVVVKAYGQDPVDTVKTDVTDVSLLSDKEQDRIAEEYRLKHRMPENTTVGIWDARFVRMVKGGE